MYYIGLDEVGRGSLAGPMVVGAVLLSSGEDDLLVESICRDCKVICLRDSKKMTLFARERIFEYLKDRLEWSVGLVEAGEIDKIKLTAAVELAAGRAISGLDDFLVKNAVLPGDIFVQADAGLYHPREGEYKTERYIKGDENYLPIKLASIMAKVWRDRLMVNLARDYSGYGWEKNVGYGTAEHIQGIRSFGLTPYHRRLFCRHLG